MYVLRKNVKKKKKKILKLSYEKLSYEIFNFISEKTTTTTKKKNCILYRQVFFYQETCSPFMFTGEQGLSLYMCVEIPLFKL